MWCSVDQGGMNPPERPGWTFPGPHLHWDVSVALPIPFGVQGILYLTDTAADQGAFTCIPGFQHKVEGWLKGPPPGADPRAQDLSEFGPTPIAGRAGDLIIWHQALPHGSSPNRAKVPRVAQYIKMMPSQWEQHPFWM
jgi:ectoine hydroxylase-related dioxygenase (phytanoyl-CoA dioxygenase family)